VADAETVALVLSGGGARCAYEIGALSVLLPALERAGQRPRLVVGTSSGALNVAFLAATAHRPAADVVAEGRTAWSELRHDDIWRPLTSRRALQKLAAFAGELAGLPVRARGLLDPAPLARTVSRLVSFDQLRRNAVEDLVHAAVVATAASTSRTVVFHTCGPSPARDEARGIDYVQTDLSRDHVLASSAIPAVFPAVRVETPARARGWYLDGSTRLNTPLKPALVLGADRVVVIGVNSVARTRPSPHPGEPDTAEGVSQLVQGVMVDPLAHDVPTLAYVNRLVEEARHAGMALNARPIPYMFIAPETATTIGRLARDVYDEHYARFRGLVRSLDMVILGRLCGARTSPVHGELFSYLFFAPEFLRALLELGRRDAERWLEQRHQGGMWRLGSPPSA
jgi:NTE family protein